MPSKYSAMGSTKTSRNGGGNGSSRAQGRNAVFWGCENVVIAPRSHPYLPMSMLLFEMHSLFISKLMAVTVLLSSRVV
jgi:hypothetical protein